MRTAEGSVDSHVGRDVQAPTADAGTVKCGEVANLGVIGGALLLVCVVVVLLVGRPKPAEVLAFVFLAGIAPPLAAFVLFVSRPATAANRLLCARVFLGFSMLGFLGLGASEYVLRSTLPGNGPVLAVIFVSLMAAFAFNQSVRMKAVARRYLIAGILDGALIGLLVIVVIFFSPFGPADRSITLVNYFVEVPHAFWWLVFGIAFVTAVAWLQKTESRISASRKILERLALAMFFLFLLSLFDDELYINLPHYLVHVGPAMHSIHGGIAMVDVYCIYGLAPWLIVKAAMTSIAPTFGAAALAVRISLTAYYVAMVVVLFAVARRRLSAMLLMVPMIFVALTFHPGLYNLNGLPSTSGLRYFLPALMVVVLTTVHSPVWRRWLATAILALASLWSIEGFIYTLAPWGYLLFLQTVRTRSIAVPGAHLLVALVAVAGAQLIFIIGTYYATGQWVDYGPYLGLVENFRPDKPGFWARAVDPNFAVWVAAWFGLFMVLAVAGYQALLQREPTDTASRLVPVAAFGFATLNYFTGFPLWSSLGLAFLPMSIVIICVMEALATSQYSLGRVGAVAMIALVGLAGSLVAFGSERFSRPALYDQANRTVLRRCFSAEGCQLAEIPKHLKQGLYASPLDPVGPVYKTLYDAHPVNMPLWWRGDSVLGYRRAKELVAILRAHAPKEPPLALLVDVTTAPFVSLTALMETGQWYRWPISSPLNDDISAGVTKLILNHVKASKIKNGELVVLSNDPSPRDRLPLAPGEWNRPERDKILSLQRSMLEIIKTRCRLALVEAREFHSIFRTTDCVSQNGPEKNTSSGDSRQE